MRTLISVFVVVCALAFPVSAQQVVPSDVIFAGGIANTGAPHNLTGNFGYMHALDNTAKLPTYIGTRFDFVGGYFKGQPASSDQMVSAKQFFWRKGRFGAFASVAGGSSISGANVGMALSGGSGFTAKLGNPNNPKGWYLVVEPNALRSNVGSKGTNVSVLVDVAYSFN